MTIKVVIEFQAKPGERSALKSLLQKITAEHGPASSGFLGSTFYEMLDSTDGLVEIAEWESADEQASAVAQVMAAGLYAPVIELVAAPFKATRIGEVS
jgi:quinol monooxygenase YgiN